MRLMIGLALGSLVLPAVSWADDEPTGYVIEAPIMDPSDPMPAVDLKRFNDGKLPRFRNSLPVLYGVSVAGHPRNRCRSSKLDKAEIYWHRADPRLILAAYADSEVSIDSILKFQRCHGMRVLRGKDGKLQQASTIADVYFIREEGTKVTVDRYRAIDCETNRDGAMVPRAGAKREFRVEEWEDPKERTPTSRVIRSWQQVENGKPDRVIVTKFSETAALSEVETLSYRGEKEAPENLIGRSTIQRAPWPEGPGYLQIIKKETLQPGQGMVLETNAVESWTVDKEGVRNRVKVENLLDPDQEEKPAAEDF